MQNVPVPCNLPSRVYGYDYDDATSTDAVDYHGLWNVAASIGIWSVSSIVNADDHAIVNAIASSWIDCASVNASNASSNVIALCASGCVNVKPIVTIVDSPPLVSPFSMTKCQWPDQLRPKSCYALPSQSTWPLRFHAVPPHCSSPLAW